jgi:hypothetical protein
MYGSLETVTSCIDPSVRILTKSPMVEPLYYILHLSDNTSFADPDPGANAFLTRNPRLEKSGSGINIPESLVTIFWVKNTQILCCGS